MDIEHIKTCIMKRTLHYPVIKTPSYFKKIINRNIRRFFVLAISLLFVTSVGAQVLTERFENVAGNEAGWVTAATTISPTLAAAQPTISYTNTAAGSTSATSRWAFGMAHVFNTGQALTSITACYAVHGGAQAVYLDGSSSAFLITPLITQGVSQVNVWVWSSSGSAILQMGFATNTTITGNTASLINSTNWVQSSAFSIGATPPLSILANKGYVQATFTVHSSQGTKPGYLVFRRVGSNFSLDDLVVTGAATTASFTQLTTGIATSPMQANSTNKAILGFAATSSGSQTLTAFNAGTTSNSSGVLTNIKLFSSTDNSYATAGDNTEITGISVTQTASQIQVSSIAGQTLGVTAKNYFLVADVTGSVNSSTASLTPSLTNANVTVGSGTVNAFTITGTAYSFQALATFSQLTTGIATSPLPGGSTNKAILGFSAVSTSSQSLTALNVATSTTSIGKLTNIKLYSSTDNSYATAGDNTEITGITVNQTATQIQLSVLGQTITSSAKNYFVVADINAAVNSSTAALQPSLTNSNVTSGDFVNTFSFSGTNYSFIAVATFNQITNGIASSPLIAGTADKAIIGFSAVSTSSQSFSAVNVNTSSASSGVLNNIKVFSSTDNSYTTAGDNTEITGLSVTQTATQIQISGLAQTLTTAAKNYFVVVDIDGSVNGSTPNLQASITEADVSVDNLINSFSISGTDYSFQTATSPTINIDQSLLAFGNVAIGSPATLSYNVSGSNLTDDIVITAPAGFQVSDDGGLNYFPSITLTQTGGIVNNTLITVQFDPASTGNFDGNVISNESVNDAIVQNVNLTGAGIAAEPNSPATSLLFSAVTASSMTASWSNGNGSRRIVVMRAGAVPTAPSDNNDYGADANFGDGNSTDGGNSFVIFNGTGSSVSITNLSPGITYTVAVYEYNDDGGGLFANYLTTSFLSGNKSTLASEPLNPATSLVFSGITTTGITASWTNPVSNGGTNRLVVVKAGSAPAAPTDGNTYSANPAFGSGASTDGGSSFVVFNGNGTSVPVTGLSTGTTYYFAVYEFNGSGGIQNYLTGSFLSGNRITLSPEPGTASSGISFSAVTGTSMTVNWTTSGNGANRIVVARQGASPVVPTDGTTYSAAAFGAGSTTGTGSFVVYSGNGNSASVTGLASVTSYTFSVFEFNGSGGSENYLVSSSLSGTQSTIGATYTWTGAAANNNWATGTNWSPTRTTPATTDFLQFNTSAGITSMPATETIASLSISGGATVSLAGTSTLTINSSLSVAASSTLTEAATVNISTANGSAVTVASTGTINVNAGTLKIGASGSTATATINGTLNVGAGTYNTTNGVTSVDGASAAMNHNGATNITGASATLLLFKNGATYTLTGTGGTIPTANWTGNGTSTCKVTGVVGTTKPGGISQTFYDFTWDCPGTGGGKMDFNASPMDCLGTMWVKQTGTTQLQVCGSSAANWVITGKYKQTAGLVSIWSGSGGNRSMTVGGTFELSGGTLIISELTGTGTGTLNAKGDVTITSPGVLKQVNTGATFTLNGTTTQTVTGLTGSAISGVINFTGTNAGKLGSNMDVTGTLALASKLDLNGHTLTVNGNITGMSATNSFIGSSASGLVINGSGALTSSLFFDQASNGVSNALNSMTFNRTSGTATLGNKLYILDSYLPTAGVLTTGGFLNMRSTLTKTARIGPGTAPYISGNVVVERHIKQGTYRSWRLLSAPTAGQTINAAWQEGATAPGIGTPPENASANNPNPGFGTIITTNAGYTGSVTLGSNGFDYNTPGSSILSYNGTAWVPGVAGTTAAIASEQGYMLFVRGDRSIGVQASTNQQEGSGGPTVLRTTGTISQGTLAAVTVADGSAHTLVGNKYASAIDFLTVFAASSGIKNEFQVWDPAVDGGNPGLGAYVVFRSADGYLPFPDYGKSYASGVANTRIESGSAFFVADAAAGGGGSVVLTEAAKVSGSNNVYRPLNIANPVVFTSNLFMMKQTGRALADGNKVKFDEAYSDEVDNDDAIKMSNFGINFGILRGDKTLIIESRKPVTAEDVLPFKMWNLSKSDYELELTATGLAETGVTAILEDRYTGSSKVLDMIGKNVYSFTVNTEPGSSASDRLRVVFQPSATVPVRFTALNAFQKNADIQVDWKLATENGISRYEVEHSLDGRNFTKSGTVAAANAGSYSWLDVQPAAGTHYYRIKGIGVAGDAIYTSIVKVLVGKGRTGITVYPNPVKDGLVTLQFTNQAAGKYGIRLINDAGQSVYRSTTIRSAGNGSETFSLPKGITKGIYKLEVITPGNKTSVEKIIIN